MERLSTTRLVGFAPVAVNRPARDFCKATLQVVRSSIDKNRVAGPSNRCLHPPMNTCLRAALFAFGLLTLSTARAADYFPPRDSEGGWRTLKDAAQIRDLAGMDLRRLDQAYDLTQRCTKDGGMIVGRHGYLVYEKYFGRAHRNANPDMASTGKAYTSIACGIMLHEFHDKIPDGLDTKVFTPKYLPEAFPLDDP